MVSDFFFSLSFFSVIRLSSCKICKPKAKKEDKKKLKLYYFDEFPQF